MTNPKLLALSLCTLFLFSFTACLRKGADDPLISFRTRKARMEGKWTMVNGFKSQITNNGYTIQVTYTDNKYELVRNFKGYLDVFDGNVTFDMEFDKDGKAKMNRVLEAYDQSIFPGTWSFAGGVGNIKEKEQLVVHNSLVTQNPDIIFFIKELRHKKLVIYRELQSEEETYKEQFEFKQ